MIPPARPPSSAARYRMVLLVGFMGSGKSVVGPRVAARLGWVFIDADDEVEARVGASIEELFQDRGEPGFREVEAQVMSELLERSSVVLATGGGWPAAGAERLTTLPSDVLSVWLKVPAETAVERVGRGGRVRPLLEVDDPLARARLLLERRDISYAAAHLHLDTTAASPNELANAIVRHVTARPA